MAKSKPLSANVILILSAMSVLFCWMYGVVGLSLGIYSLVRILKIKGRGRSPKRRWALSLSVAGIICSFMFFIFYLLVFIRGAYIRFF